MIKKFFWMGLLTFGLPSAYGFSLLGPIANGPDAYQVDSIGYNVGGDIGAPKNLGEEYRRNTPVMYYAYDATFLDYFGSNGVVAIDQAFAVMNALTNVDDYNYTDQSATNQFPFNTTMLNPTAGAENLRDLKSQMLEALMEQVGLANSVRWTWALHDRFTVPQDTNPCPADLEYLVIQRNFDPITLQPTDYVDNTLYGYQIIDNCGQGPEPESDAVETTAGPVAGLPVTDGFGSGQFFTGLTWDDVGGLRYLYTSNNVNFENLPPGTFAETINSNAPIFLTTSNLNLLVSDALTNTPDTMQALFPGLELASTNYYFTNVPVITAYLTNFLKGEAGAPPALFVGVTSNVEQVFQYTFANVVTNSSTTSTVVTNEVIQTVQAEDGFVLQTNYTRITTNLLTGDYFIIPTGGCPPDIFQTLQANVITATNTIISTNIVGANGVTFFYSQSLIYHYTNHVFGVAPCTLQTNAPALYQGIERMKFVRADFDSLLGRFFAPITNNYTMNMVTNSQVVPQTLQRIVIAPDFVISAADLAPGPSDIPAAFTYRRNINFDPTLVPTNAAGPGTINPTTTIAFNKVGNIFLNGPTDDTNAPPLDQTTQSSQFVWGSFDVSTNIIVYPNGTDIQNLENQALIHISPVSPLPNATSGVSFPATTFTTTGGAFTPPFT
ncbi:MAG: hypothetical protein ACREDS_00460, partial [Limisphaerales bacterium]